MVAEQAPFDRPMLYTESNRVPVETGTGVAGTGGIVPQIKAISPPVLGNPNFTVSLNGALGNATAILVVSTRNYTAIPRHPSVRGLFRGTATTANTGAGNGWASLSFTFLEDAIVPNATYYARWFIEDPAAPGGYSMTPAMRFTLFAPTSTAPLSAREDTVESALGAAAARIDLEK